MSICSPFGSPCAHFVGHVWTLLVRYGKQPSNAPKHVRTETAKRKDDAQSEFGRHLDRLSTIQGLKFRENCARRNSRLSWQKNCKTVKRVPKKSGDGKTERGMEMRFDQISSKSDEIESSKVTIEATKK